MKHFSQTLEFCYVGVRMQLFQISGFDMIKFAHVQLSPLKVNTKGHQKHK